MDPLTQQEILDRIGEVDRAIALAGGKPELLAPHVGVDSRSVRGWQKGRTIRAKNLARLREFIRNAEANVTIPTIRGSATAAEQNKINSNVREPAKTYVVTEGVDAVVLELKQELDACRRECQELRTDNRTLREENRELRNELKRFSKGI